MNYRILLALLILSFAGQANAEWSDSLNLGGDFRFRHENRQDGENNRHRVWQNIRARINLKAKFNDKVEAQMRFTSGEGSPRGTNQGFKQSFTKKPFNLSRGFFKFKLSDHSQLWTGKMAQPFYKAGKSDLVWDHDVSPEGAAYKYQRSMGDSFKVFAAAYNFWLEENKNTDDVMLYGGQLGVTWQNDERKFNLVASTYNYNHIRNTAVLVDTAKNWGNTATDIDPSPTDESFTYDYGYRLLNVGFDYSMTLAGMPFKIYVDTVSNSAVDDNGSGTLFGIGLGKTKAQGDWSLSVNSRDLEADSVLAAFTDADFAGGNTDSKGLKVKVAYMLYDKVKFAIAHFDTEYNSSSATPTEFSKTQVEVFATF